MDKKQAWETLGLEIGSIVQLNPERVRVKCFAGCLMTVTEIKAWGIQGYIQGIGETKIEMGGQYYYRAKWEEIELTGGHNIWMR